MKNLDVENTVNPFLVENAIISFEMENYKVIDMTKEFISITNERNETRKITDHEWNPIRLDDNWIVKFGFGKDLRIKNSDTDRDWEIKTTGQVYYLTIHSEYGLGENPVFPLRYVHDLQYWYFMMTNQLLII